MYLSVTHEQSSIKAVAASQRVGKMWRDVLSEGMELELNEGKLMNGCVQELELEVNEGASICFREVDELQTLENRSVNQQKVSLAYRLQRWCARLG